MISVSVASHNLVASLGILSVTIPPLNLFSWGNGIQGNDAQLFVYEIDNNGMEELGVSPCPSLRAVGGSYYDGAQHGLLGWTNIVVSGARDPVNSCRVIGRVNVHQAMNSDWQNPTVACVIDEPIHKTDYLSWTPRHDRSTSAYISAYTNPPTVYEAKYSIDGTRLFWQETHVQAPAPGGSGWQRFTAPIPARHNNSGTALNGLTVNQLHAFVFGEYITLYKPDGSAEANGSQVYHASGFYEVG